MKTPVGVVLKYASNRVPLPGKYYVEHILRPWFHAVTAGDPQGKSKSGGNDER
jgi:hypothetical protein